MAEKFINLRINENLKVNERQILRSMAKKNMDDVFPDILSSKVHDHRHDVWQSAVDLIGPDTPVEVYDFGVYQGASTKFWANGFRHKNSRFFGFDSFKGLPEDWVGKMTKGKFDTGGVIPDIDDDRVTFIKGWIQNTLPGFFQERKEDKTRTVLIHIDTDLYSSALFILCQCWNIFDDFYLAFDEFGVDENMAFADFMSAFPVSAEYFGYTNNPESNLPKQLLSRVRKIEYNPD